MVAIHNTPVHLVALIVAAILGPLSQALLFGLEGQPIVYLIVAIFLVILQPLLVRQYLNVPRLYFLFALLFLLCGQLWLMISVASDTSFPAEFKLPHHGLILLHVAALSSLLLVQIKLMMPANAVLLSFSTAVGFILLEASLVFYGSFSKTDKVEWNGSMEPHPIIGIVPRPHSVLKAFYPDDTRGYFKLEDMRERKWSLRVDGENAANMELPADDSHAIRVSIQKAVGQPYNIQLNQVGLHLRGHQRYILSFRVRAEASRTISFGVSKNHEPWDDLGLYRTIPVASTWSNFHEEFIAKEDDDKVRIVFDLGQNESSVDITDVALRSLSDDKLVEPDLPAQKYVVTYEFNSLGCRGPDYVIPRPSDTTRILFLGDSFTQGSGSYEQDTLPAQLNKLINERVAKKGAPNNIEVINCGISGYDTRQERLFYEERGFRYGASLVVLAMTWNDDMSYLEEVARGYDKRRSESGKSLLSQWWIKAQDDRPFPGYEKCVLEILRLNDSIRDQGAQLLVVLYRTGSEADRPRISFQNWLRLSEDTITLEQRLLTDIREGLKDTAIPVLDLGPPLRERLTFEQLVVHSRIDSHPNNIAHGVAAHEILKFLQSRHLVGL